MNNYKIKVTSEAESKEAQELFFELGYKKGMCSLGNYPAVIVTTQDWATGNYCSTRAIGLDIPAHDNYTEITILELRDLVVLKRNNVDDATHINTVTDSKVLQQGNKNYYWYSGEWHLYPCGVDIRPIEKTMKKEYLIPSRNYEYILTDAREGLEPHAEDWIEIPVWANYAYNNDSGIYFMPSEIGFNHPLLIWHRPTQPEELPFIDDEPTLDKIKIKVDGNLNRAIDIAKSEGYYNCQFNRIPEGAYWLLCNEDGTVDYSMNENILNEYMMLHDDPKSTNDQYAEIEQVRQEEIHGAVKANPDFNFGSAQPKGGVDATLAERQSQYGCYEDVAQVTQQILSALRIGNYDELPAPMKESLHMIASKMARIVNGDPEYFDNWHDIGGYAKLIEKLIKGE